MTARELNDSGCQHGNGEILAASTGTEGFWMHIWQGRDSGCIQYSIWEGSGFHCLDVDGRGEISGCLHEKGGVLAAGTEREGSGCWDRKCGI